MCCGVAYSPCRVQTLHMPVGRRTDRWSRHIKITFSSCGLTLPAQYYYFAPSPKSNVSVEVTEAILHAQEYWSGVPSSVSGNGARSNGSGASTGGRGNGDDAQHIEPRSDLATQPCDIAFNAVEGDFQVRACTPAAVMYLHLGCDCLKQRTMLHLRRMRLGNCLPDVLFWYI